MADRKVADLFSGLNPNTEIIAAITLSSEVEGSRIFSNFRPKSNLHSALNEVRGDGEQLLTVIPISDDLRGGASLLGAISEEVESVELTISCLVAEAFKQGARWRDVNPDFPLE